MSQLYAQPDYWVFGYAEGDSLYTVTSGSSITAGSILGRLILGGGATGSAAIVGKILRRLLASVTTEATSSVSLRARLQMRVSTESLAVSVIRVNARILWDRQSTPDESWTAQAESEEVWAEPAIGGNPATWTAQVDDAEIWTEQETGSETWT